MLKWRILPVLTVLGLWGNAQVDSSIMSLHKSSIDRYKAQLAIAQDDTTRIDLLQHLNFDYESENSDSSVKYGLAALALCRKTGNIKQEARTLSGLSSVLRQQGKFAEALDALFQARQLAEKVNFTFEVARSFRRTALVYSDLEDYHKALENALRGWQIDETIPDIQGTLMIDHMLLANIYESLNQLDSALDHAGRCLRDRHYHESLIQSIFLTLGKIYAKKNDLVKSLDYYRQGAETARRNADLSIGSSTAIDMAHIFMKMGLRDSALQYAQLGYTLGKKVSYKRGVMLSGKILADLYAPTDPVTALKYFRIASAAQDSLYGAGNSQTIQSMVAREEERRRKAETDVVTFRNHVRIYALLAGAAILLLVTYLLYRNNRRQKSTNATLLEQKQEIEKTLQLLKTTQSQLIQSEKMASLGQLTAGIAHEIQNPLNFVNNFAELNEELLDEAARELESGNTAGAGLLITDIKENIKKIAQHGRRADAIVKSMLQHSRSGSGKIEAVNINELAEQYLRIALQSVRNQDGLFTPDIQTHFDPALGSMSLVREDLGRVLFNLYDNAFYTLRKKANQNIEDFKPQLSVTTRQNPDNITIMVEDNGQGIAISMQDKIFQPFFTTRPTGQGTGLGLSLSYDIITKGYHGSLTVSSMEGEGARFIMVLPV